MTLGLASSLPTHSISGESILQAAEFKCSAATFGGRTALELQGFAHYLSSAPQRQVHLYGTDKRPVWILKLNLETRFVLHNAKRLFPNDVVMDADKEANDVLVRSSYVRQTRGKWEWPLVVSSSERAILELLDEMPERETFHQVDMLLRACGT